MNRKLLFLILLHCSSLLSIAQFNDSVHHYINLNAAGNLNKTNTSDSYILNNSLRFSIKKKAMVLNFNNTWLYGQQNNKLSNNDYSGTLDFNLYQKIPGLYYWGLTNFTTSYSLKIINQLQTGLGAAYNIFDKEKAQLNISNGILYENNELRNSDLSITKYQTLRNSFRLYFKYVLLNAVIWEGTGYLQNSLNYRNDYIIRTNTGISFKVNKYFNLNTTLKYNKLQKTQKENLLVSYGFKAEAYF